MVGAARALPNDRIPGSAYCRERPANAADAASRATARRRISRAGRGMHEKALQKEGLAAAPTHLRISRAR